MFMSPFLRAVGWLRGLAIALSLSYVVPAAGAPAKEVDAEKQSAEATPTRSRRKISLRVMGPDGRPVPKAKVNVGIWSEEKFRPPKTNLTDAAGAVEIELPQQLRIVRFWVSADKLVTMFVHWEEKDEPEKNLPAEVTIPLEAGTKIGGYVVDENDKPIADATVKVE